MMGYMNNEEIVEDLAYIQYKWSIKNRNKKRGEKMNEEIVADLAYIQSYARDLEIKARCNPIPDSVAMKIVEALNQIRMAFICNPSSHSES